MPTTDVQTCRVCGCTDLDCRKCVEAQGEPCYWIEEDLCSRCALGIPDADLPDEDAATDA